MKWRKRTDDDEDDEEACEDSEVEELLEEELLKEEKEEDEEEEDLDDLLLLFMELLDLAVWSGLGLVALAVAKGYELFLLIPLIVEELVEKRLARIPAANPPP